MNVEQSLSSFYQIEVEARRVYTNKIFSMFKKVLKDSSLGSIKEIEKDALYEVNINSHPWYPNWIPETHKIKVEKEDEIISCSCKGYEFEGLLCSHAIKIMQHVGILHLPTRYIMKRWCKEANAGVKRSIVERSMDLGESQELEEVRSVMLKSEMNELLKIASKSRDVFGYVKDALGELKQKMIDMVGVKATLSNDMGTMALADRQPKRDVTILDPPVSQCKGKRKQPQRFKPPSEAKKLRKCRICGTKGGHNSRTCPLKTVKGSGKVRLLVDRTVHGLNGPKLC
ncbi:hypothetical protein LUZ61_017912 [Rhynchospora tenuis]|uniref:Protein FAR1-RELATED SEQUENCE n=1 Tax=Rhynchospora tenuis TaxID=198213 RepID=A0AAD5Z8C3_9POAL|nr:hypothetical protein LUZ61_017912 [Rhynchospora tenuis]